MKKILFDIISLQGYHNGGEEYTRIVLKELLKINTIEIVGLYDSDEPFLDDDENFFKGSFPLADIRNKSLTEIVDERGISLFYIGILQRYIGYNLSKLNCKVICTIHDIGDVEFYQNRIFYFFKRNFKNRKNVFFDIFFKKFSFSAIRRTYTKYSRLLDFIKGNDTALVTVSQYSKYSILYYFPELASVQINVLYPPLKNYGIPGSPKNVVISEILHRKEKFILCLNINRENKNFSFVKQVFERLRKETSDFKLVATGASADYKQEDIYYFKYLDNSDIELLYQNAWALVYPSFTEGFGYPPTEAMKYSTPVISSNVCSIPEVLKNGALYFSPFYPSDLYFKIRELEANYDKYVNLASKQYKEIAHRQEADLERLITLISKF